jgi:hypothetical protein
MMTTTTNKLMLLTGAVLFAAAAFFFPAEALAGGGGQTVDMNQQARQLGEQMSNIPRLIAMASYVIGAFFAVRALFALKGFIESPDDNPVTKVLSFGAVAALLILLPYIIGVMTNTIGANTQNVTSSSASFTDDGSFN